ncbi:MAG: L-serine ammonia-lyase, iron-sulfur-dependent, subunit beta, partial [Flammeovirgaceae bacterium]
YEGEQKGRNRDDILKGLAKAWGVMKDAVRTGLEEDMISRSGMVNNGAKKVFKFPKPVLSKEFQNLISRALAAKEVNSCMGRVVAAPTAGASGIMPGVLFTVQEIHAIDDAKIL